MSNISIIQSPNAAISALHFLRFPSRPFKVSKAARSYETVVMVGDKGEVYSTKLQKGFSYPVGYRGSNIDDTLLACVKLGIITEADLAEHESVSKALALKAEHKYRAKSMLSAAEVLGITFNATQKKKLEAAIAAGNKVAP